MCCVFLEANVKLLTCLCPGRVGYGLIPWGRSAVGLLADAKEDFPGEHS